MSYSYEQKKKQGSKKNGAEPSVVSGKESSLPNSAMMNELGHRVDMPVVMREKMEGAFGMDLSGVKLYENRAVGKAGAEAVTQGSNIAFAPGKLDFSSTRGQALLGHEISHVASQARGEVKGKGLVNDSALEARADREGLMAARGESVASAPLSTASAASAAGPMQAKSGKKKQAGPEEEDWGKGGIVDEMLKTRSVKKRVNRGVGGTIADYFRTIGSHWNKKSKSSENREIMDRGDAEIKEMALFDDNDLVPMEIGEEEKMPLLPLLENSDNEEPLDENSPLNLAMIAPRHRKKKKRK